MQQEMIYGNGSLHGRYDGHAPSKLASSEECLEEELKRFFETMNEFMQGPLDINHSNRRLDSYLFYFSSKL